MNPMALAGRLSTVGTVGTVAEEKALQGKLEVALFVEATDGILHDHVRAKT